MTCLLIRQWIVLFCGGLHSSDSLWVYCGWKEFCGFLTRSREKNAASSPKKKKIWLKKVQSNRKELVEDGFIGIESTENGTFATIVIPKFQLSLEWINHRNQSSYLRCKSNKQGKKGAELTVKWTVICKIWPFSCPGEHCRIIHLIWIPQADIRSRPPQPDLRWVDDNWTDRCNSYIIHNVLHVCPPCLFFVWIKMSFTFVISRCCILFFNGGCWGTICPWISGF